MRSVAGSVPGHLVGALPLATGGKVRAPVGVAEGLSMAGSTTADYQVRKKLIKLLQGQQEKRRARKEAA